VLRETVTNMLRHSTPRNCVIEAAVAGGSIQLSVSNDGVPRSALSRRRGGGLDNLRTRLEAIGGTLNVEAGTDGWYRVRAETPLEPPGTPEPAASPDADADALLTDDRGLMICAT
jgi:two-component system sensor histidine kinase DesK